MSHVLIIEDEPMLALLLETLLREEGADSFDFAASETEAVDRALNHRPDIITSDVRLTSGTGPRAVRTIHERLGPIPVIFITASPDECSPCDPPGVILTKPLASGALGAAYHQMMPV